MTNDLTTLSTPQLIDMRVMLATARSAALHGDLDEALRLRGEIQCLIENNHHSNGEQAR